MPYSSEGITITGATAVPTTDVLLSVRDNSGQSSTYSAPGVDIPPQTTVDSIPDQMEIPGDLGQRYISGEDQIRLAKAYRTVYADNLLYPRNMRYRGHRESAKFNLTLQCTLTKCAEMFLNLKGYDTRLAVSEYKVVVTDTEIANIYHIGEQLAFQEWFKLRDLNTRWFE